jgi:hypothetical protein
VRLLADYPSRCQVQGDSVDNKFEKQNLDVIQRRALREHVRDTVKSPGLLLEILSIISQRETRIIKFWNDKREGVVLPLLETTFTETNKPTPAARRSS